MEDSKLVQHLKLLHPKEFKPFRRFLQSPYHNRQPLLEPLFKVLAQHFLSEKVRPITETEVALQLFPGEAFDQNRFRKLGTSLLQALHNFFKVEALHSDPVRGELYLLERFRNAQADRFLPAQIQKTQRALGEQPLLPIQRLDFELELGMVAYAFETRQAQRRPETRPEQLLRSLEHSYAIQKMRLLYIQLNHLKVTGEGETPQADRFIQSLAPELKDLPLEALLYYHLYLCTENPELDQAFTTLRSLLTHHGKKLAPSDAEDIYVGAINFCIQAINRGERAYLRTNWDLYWEMIDLDLFEIQGGPLKAHFKNLLWLAARLGEFEKGGQFLQDYQSAIVGNHNANALHFGRGVLSFFQGQLSVAEGHFYRILDDFADVFFGLDARVYLLRIYYETGNTISLEAMCDSTRMFLKRNKSLSGHRKANYQHFLNYMRRLSRIPHFDQKRLTKLRLDIVEGRKISGSRWLLEKVDEALGGKKE